MGVKCFLRVKYFTFCNITCECLISGFLMGSMLLLVSCLDLELVAQATCWLGPVEGMQGRGGGRAPNDATPDKTGRTAPFRPGKSMCTKPTMGGWGPISRVK